MAPPPGRSGGTMKLPVQVRMLPAEIAAVDACAAALSQQRYGAAFSRPEALRIAAMEWLKERQASHARVPPVPPQRELEAAPALEAEAAPADTEPVPVVPPPGPPNRQGQILVALTAAGRQGLRPAEVRQATGVPQGMVASALQGLGQRGQVRTVHDRSVATGQARAAGP